MSQSTIDLSFISEKAKKNHIYEKLLALENAVEESYTSIKYFISTEPVPGLEYMNKNKSSLTDAPNPARRLMEDEDSTWSTESGSETLQELSDSSAWSEETP